MKKQIAIFASGEGSNALALLTKARELTEYCQMTTVICDRPNAPILDKLKDFSVNCFLIPATGPDRNGHENKILPVLRERKIDWVFLAGYMRILSGNFIKEFYDPKLKVARIVNIHPSLLPQFPGLRAYQNAFMANINPHGVTIHFVDEGIDTGSIIAQEKFDRFAEDTLDDFIRRGKSVEHALYQSVLGKIAMGRPL